MFAFRLRFFSTAIGVSHSIGCATTIAIAIPIAFLFSQRFSVVAAAHFATLIDVCSARKAN